MGPKTKYNHSWNTVYDYLRNPKDPSKHAKFYRMVEPIIKHWLLKFSIQRDLDNHAKSIFADLYLKEQKRYLSGKLVPEKCNALTTTYYFPVIKNLCFDYANLLKCKMPYSADIAVPESISKPGVFDELWGEYRSTVLQEMRRCVKDCIELSSFESAKKEYLRQRFIYGRRFQEILNGLGKSEFEAVRKWIRRQGTKIAITIAKTMLPAIIDSYKLPISKEIDPRIIEKHLLGAQIKMAI